MGDSTQHLPQMSAAADDREIVFNGVEDAGSPASLYGRDYRNCTGLTWAYFGGRFASIAIANGTVTATASTVNYIVAHRTTGVVSISTATTNWGGADTDPPSATYLRLYKLTTVTGSAITAWVDHRMGLSAATTAAATGTAGTLDFDIDGTLAANSDVKIATQKATKTYVDAKVAGLSWKQAVRVATTANGTLATAFENADTVDGVTLATGDRILLKNQSAGAENGIYIVGASGAPVRATDADSGAELVNATMYVSEGTANADTQWTCSTNAAITVGTTALTFVQLSSSASVSRELQVMCSDMTTALTAGTNKAYARAPRAMTVSGVRASLFTAQATDGGGGIFTVDIHEAGTTILSTKLTIDNTEKTSTTAAAAAVISDSAIADDAEITIDIDQIGDGTAKGLIVTIIYT